MGDDLLKIQSAEIKDTLLGSEHMLNILQGSSIAHFVINKDHTIVHWNRACENMTGYSAEKMLGTKNQWMPFYSAERPCIADLLLDHAPKEVILKYYKGMKLKNWELLEGAYEVEGFFAPLGKTGKWLRFTAAPLKNGKGEIIGALETLEDITERKIAEEDREKLNRELIKSNRKLRQMALRDPSTGLYNYRYLEEVLEAEFMRAKRYEQSLSLIMLDIDYFKSINDMYGHQFGDLVLKQLAKQLKKMVRRYDIVIRCGGEEFIIVSPSIDRFQSVILAQRILDEINIYNFGDKKHTIKLKVSLAVVSYPEEKIVKSMNLLEYAEQILNKCKEWGGNRVCSSYDVNKFKPRSVRKGKERREDVSALKNKLGKLTKQANQSLIESIFAFARTIELKDHYTGEHVERTVYYATHIARMLKFNGKQIENVRQAAILHDLGKVGISDKILLKDSKLTEDEYKEIKKHPLIAADILRPIQFLHSVIPFILYHHERWDGRGYPSGLKGDSIPVGARIIAIADVYQALISNRPYRKALARQEALKIIREGSGTQFDPKIVNVFLKIIQKKK
jgi:diguanylate cyclase (GGDEF)-like protein